MQPTISDKQTPRRVMGRHGLVWLGLLVSAWFGTALASHSAASHASKDDASTQPSQQLAIQVNDDRLTLAAAKVPQIYLYGVMDAGAPERFNALVRSGKIPPDSDIYLDSASGDLNAGLALGRLFRANSLVTHLGVPRRTQKSAVYMAKTASCIDACAYAYFGGLYRWSPAGDDRFGVHAANAANGTSKPSAEDIAAYLKEMGINAAALTPNASAAGSTASTSSDGMAWLTADQMIATGLANNGYQLMTHNYLMSPGASTLTLNQAVRGGAHKLVIVCKANGLTINAYNTVGTGRASQIVARGTQAHFELDEHETLPQQYISVSAVNDMVLISSPYSSGLLQHLLSARLVGAWLSDRNDAIRYGFIISLSSIRGTLSRYADSCDQIAQQGTARKP